MSNLTDEEYDAEQNISCKDSDIKPSSAMFLYLRELFFLFALIFTSYTALFNSLPRIGKAPTPIPFFPRNSVIVDYYKGNVKAAFQRASEVDLTIVMYYAPWDAESQIARHQFESTAEILHKEVFFTAISCWSPTSECKQHVPRIRYFPVIVAYPQHSKGIQYQGPIKSVYMINFVKAVMRPIQRIFSAADLVHLASQYNVVVVGSFLFNGNLGGPGYYTFYSASLKMLEKDPFHEIAFAVTTSNEMAASLYFDSVPSVRLYLWNETYDYPSDADYTDESLVKWIWNQIRQVVQWVSPPKVKSLMLSPYISKGPTLFLFTPRNPLVEVNPMYNMLKEIALRYYNCNENKWVKHLLNFIELKNTNLKFSQRRLESYCQMKKRKNELNRTSIYQPSIIVPNIFPNISNSIEDVCDAGGLHSKYLGPQSEVCFRRSKVSEMLLASLKEGSGSSFVFKKPDRSPEHLLKMWEQDKCRDLELGNEYHRLPHPKSFETSFNQSFDGLACYNNKTLSIIAMDSLSHYQFAEGLGINILHVKDKTAAVIIDMREDSQFIMSSVMNKENLMSFIMNHTRGQLQRFLRSSHNAEFKSVSRYKYPVIKMEDCVHTETESCVPELSSKNFMQYVMDQDKAAIVFYHTPYCALCRSISHLFLLLSRYFRHFPGLKFARIDGDNNDLPWEYTMDLYPALLYFPTVEKSESRLYSNDLSFTMKNLIHFVLANLEPEAKIPAMMSLCISFEKLQNEHEARKCKSKIQRESYENLSSTLKGIRRVMNLWKNLPPTSKYLGEIRWRKKILLHKLEYFKWNHFLLSSVDKIELKSEIVTDIMKLYFKFLRLIRNNSYYLNYDGYR